MAKDRARRRAERQQQAQIDRARRAREVRRREAAQARRAWWSRWIPARPHTTPGLLARRKRRRLAVLVGIIAVVCIITWPLLPDWGARLIVLAGLLMAAPVAWVLSFGRV